MRRTALLCLAAGALAALGGCSAVPHSADRAAATPPAATTVSPPSPAVSATPTVSASATGGDNTVKSWAATSPQFRQIIPITALLNDGIIKGNGDPQKVGDACLKARDLIAALHPEPGAPKEWPRVVDDLHKAAATCDAVRADQPGALDQLNTAYSDAIDQLQAITGRM